MAADLHKNARSEFLKRLLCFIHLYFMKMKKRVSLLLLFVLANMWAGAQEQYHFTVDYGSKQDTIAVYDAHDNVVLLFGKDVFVYRQAPVTVAKDKRSLVFSSAGKELGKVSSKKYKKIYLADSSMYVLESGKKKLSYKKDGRVCASAGYSYSCYPYFSGNKVDVEMSIDDTDLSFTPFLFQSTLAHIQGTRTAEQLFWITLF
jgi:hypothetical protein